MDKIDREIDRIREIEYSNERERERRRKRRLEREREGHRKWHKGGTRVTSLQN